MDDVQNKRFGEWGEQKALEYLMGKGYTVVAKGFRSRFGEIDLIMKSKEYLVFLEVKSRRSSSFAHAREYVSKTKQGKMISTAMFWLQRWPTKLQPRFDVVEVYASQGVDTVSPKIVHIENAFDLRN